jgi:hypothetical protein
VQPADEHEAEEEELGGGNHRSKSAVAKPVVVWMLATWKAAVRKASLRAGVVVAEEEEGDDEGGGEEDGGVGADFEVGEEAAGVALDEEPVVLHEVDPGEEHEEDEDPLDEPGSRSRRCWPCGWRTRRCRGSRRRGRPLRSHVMPARRRRT